MASETFSLKQLLAKLRALSRIQLLLLTALATLLPALLGLLLHFLRLPDRFALSVMPGSRDAVQLPVLLAILGIPLICFVAQLLLCLMYDPEEKHGTFHTVWWMIPVVSHLTSYMTCALAMGAEYTLLSYGQLLLGLALTFLGGRIPKLPTNGSVGFRVPWVFTSRHNWRATHRFAGYCWMIGGLLMVTVAFIPMREGLQLTCGILLLLFLLPSAFSFFYYLRQRAKGEPHHHVPRPGKGLLVLLGVLLAALVLVLFTGSLRFSFREDSMTIQASYYQDFTLDYQDIQKVEYCGTDVEGSRIGGSMSLRLQVGYYHDEELGTYTRYTYARPDACVLVTLPDRLLVLSGKTMADTQALYQQLLAKLP